MIEKASELPGECESLGRIYAEDGWVGSRRWAYEGTEQRALKRLANEAAMLRANYIVLHRDRFEYGIPLDEAHGHSAQVEATACWCPLP